MIILFGNGFHERCCCVSSRQSRFVSQFAVVLKHDRRFGTIRVINDDLVQPDRGFGTHGHKDMEILTYVVHGQLTHEDSMGNVESLGRGSMQFMTAGTGVEHSEYNHSPDAPFRCIQTWILPSAYDLTPRYGSYNSLENNMGGPPPKNQLRHLASNIEKKSVTTPIQVYQDVDCFVAELEMDQQVTLEVPVGRQAYLVCIEGSLRLEQPSAEKEHDNEPIRLAHHLQKYNACEITLTIGGDDDKEGGATGGSLEITASETEETEHGDLAHFIVFVVAASDEYNGRKDF